MARTPPFIVLISLVVSTVALAQGTPDAEAEAVSEAERRAVVETVGMMLQERYVFPEIAEACQEHLAAQLAAGEFDDLSDPKAFARVYYSIGLGDRSAQKRGLALGGGDALLPGSTG